MFAVGSGMPLLTFFRVFTEQVLELHRGQGMEIYWRDNFTCPTEAEYRLMICRKTGGLFNLAVRLMQLFSTSTQDFTHLVSLLGLYFQIRYPFLLASAIQESQTSISAGLT
jgi:geranylgeranyl diphosphate synthase type 3